jgi:hypothetical protein
MTSPPETVLWTMLTGVDADLDHIHGAAVESSFRAPSWDEERINIDVPLSLRKRHRAVQYTGAASPFLHGAIIAGTADPGPLNHEHLANVEESSPRMPCITTGLTTAH